MTLDTPRVAVVPAVAQPTVAPPPAIQVAVSDEPLSGWTIGFKPLPHLFLQGNDPLAIFAALKELGRVEATVDLSGLPPLAQLDPQKCYVLWQLRLHGECAREQVEETFDWTTGDCDENFLNVVGYRLEEFDADGKPYKIVKFASDVTVQVSLTRQMQMAVSQTQEVIKSAIGGDLSRRIDAANTSAAARPWTARSKLPLSSRAAVAKEASTAHAQPIRAVANGNDSDWTEF